MSVELGITLVSCNVRVLGIFQKLIDLVMFIICPDFKLCKLTKKESVLNDVEFSQARKCRERGRHLNSCFITTIC